MLILIQMGPLFLLTLIQMPTFLANFDSNGASFLANFDSNGDFCANFDSNGDFSC